MSKRIREMTEKDVRAIVAIIRSHDSLDGKFAARYFKRYFSDPARRRSRDEKCYVAEDKATGRPVAVSGFLMDKYPTPRIHWLNWTYVDKSVRRGGLGSMLLDHVIDRVRRRGSRKLYLDTGGSPKYAAARAFYGRHGFRVEGTLRDYFPGREDCVIMARNIRH